MSYQKSPGGMHTFAHVPLMCLTLVLTVKITKRNGEKNVTGTETGNPKMDRWSIALLDDKRPEVTLKVVWEFTVLVFFFCKLFTI